MPKVQHCGMRFRILFVANLFLLSILVWPPGGSLLEFRQATVDILLRMTLAIWIWVGAVLASEYQLLSIIHRRHLRASGVEPGASRGAEGWRPGASTDRRRGDRRTSDRRQVTVPLPEGVPDRRSGGDRRLWWRRKPDHAPTAEAQPPRGWR